MQKGRRLRSGLSQIDPAPIGGLTKRIYLTGIYGVKGDTQTLKGFKNQISHKRQRKHAGKAQVILKCCNNAAINCIMTKTEIQSALAEATQTDKKTAGVFLDTLSAIAYKDTKKNGEFVLPGFGKLVKQKRKARTGFNPTTQQKIKIPAKTVVKFRVAKAAKDAVLGAKKV
jgi:DNA-binding protein HU-beta